MKKIFLMAMLASVWVACKKHSDCKNIPACVQSKIDQHRSDPNWEVGSIEEYKYQGKIVYAFQPDGKIIADGATAIYSSDCSSICYVGGFGGPSINQCNGENFYEKSVLIRVVWKKP